MCEQEMSLKAWLLWVGIANSLNIKGVFICVCVRTRTHIYFFQIKNSLRYYAFFFNNISNNLKKQIEEEVQKYFSKKPMQEWTCCYQQHYWKTYLVYYIALKIPNKARENRRCVKNEISACLPEGGKTCNHDQEMGTIFFCVFHSSVHVAEVPAPFLVLPLEIAF